MMELPYLKEAEENVLAAAIVNPDLIDQFGLNAEDFYLERNRIVWITLVRLKLRGAKIDHYSVIEALTDSQLEYIGGGLFIIQLMGYCPFPSTRAVHLADRLRECTQSRRMLMRAYELAKQAVESYQRLQVEDDSTNYC